MNYKVATSIVACALLMANSTLPLIVNARLLERIEPNGITKHVYIFGDIERSLIGESDKVKQNIKAINTLEQINLIYWAKPGKLFPVILIQDQFAPYDSTLNDSFLYNVATAIPNFFSHLGHLVLGKETYRSNFAEQCKYNHIPTVNIETRHTYHGAMVGSFVTGILVVLSALKYQLFKSSKFEIPTLLASYYSMCLLAGIARGYDDVLWEDNIEDSNFYETMELHKQLIGKTYHTWDDAQEIPLKALFHILNTTNNDTFFVCAEDVHCFNLERMLQTEGFNIKKSMIDPLAFLSHDTQINIKNPLDIDGFIKSCSGISV